MEYIYVKIVSQISYSTNQNKSQSCQNSHVYITKKLN